jgi:hypothetical protein
MHLAWEERAASFKRLKELLAPSGQMYLTFRTGGIIGHRQEFPASVDELERLAARNALEVIEASERPDLLGRPGVGWVSIALKPKPETFAPA